MFICMQQTVLNSDNEIKKLFIKLQLQIKISQQEQVLRAIISYSLEQYYTVTQKFSTMYIKYTFALS